jgi:hypothetical protein
MRIGGRLRRETMQIMHACCCGLDVHKQQIVACWMRFDEAGQRQQELRTFGTMTQDMLTLADWLLANRLHPCRDGKHGGVWEASV